MKKPELIFKVTFSLPLLSSVLKLPNNGKLQPRSQSSSAISNVTSPVKLVGKIRGGINAYGQAVSNNYNYILPGMMWILRKTPRTKPRTRYRTWFQVFFGNSYSANWPGYEAGEIT